MGVALLSTSQHRARTPDLHHPAIRKAKEAICLDPHIASPTLAGIISKHHRAPDLTTAPVASTESCLDLDLAPVCCCTLLPVLGEHCNVRCTCHSQHALWSSALVGSQGTGAHCYLHSARACLARSQVRIARGLCQGELAHSSAGGGGLLPSVKGCPVLPPTLQRTIPRRNSAYEDALEAHGLPAPALAGGGGGYA